MPDKTRPGKGAMRWAANGYDSLADIARVRADIARYAASYSPEREVAEISLQNSLFYWECIFHNVRFELPAPQVQVRDQWSRVRFTEQNGDHITDIYLNRQGGTHMVRNRYFGTRFPTAVLLLAAYDAFVPVMAQQK